MGPPPGVGMLIRMSDTPSYVLRRTQDTLSYLVVNDVFTGHNEACLSSA
jgi:hypothetical protein